MSGNDVTVKLKGDDSQLNSVLEQSKDAFTKYGSYIKVAVAGVAAALAARQVFAFASDSMAAYADAEQAENRLSRMMKNRADQIGLTMDQMGQMATKFQMLNAIEADAVTSAQGVVAAFQNINGEQFEQTLQAAADVVAQTGGSFEDASKQIAKALNDPEKGMRSLRDLGILFTEQQTEQVQKLMESGEVVKAQTILLEELGKVYGGSAAEKAQEFGSQVSQISFIIGDAQEAIGELLQELIGLVLPTVHEAAIVFGNLVSILTESAGGFEDYKDSIDEYLIGTFEWLVDSAMEAFSWLEFGWTNYTKMVERQTYSFMLTFVKAYEEVKWWLTEAIPGYLNWAAENWAEIFLTIDNYVGTVFTNMWKNVSEFFTKLWKWMSGEEASFEFVALTEGFETSIRKLPEIADRQLSDMEKMLTSNITDMDNQIGKSAVEIFDKNREMINELFARPEEVEIKPVVKDSEWAKATKLANATKKKEDEKQKKDDKDAEKTDASKENGSVGSSSDLISLAKSIQEAALKATAEAKKIEIPQPSDADVKAYEEKVEKIDELKKMLLAVPAESREAQAIQEKIDTLAGVTLMQKVEELKKKLKEAPKGSQEATVLQDKIDDLTGEGLRKDILEKRRQIKDAPKGSQEATVLQQQLVDLMTGKKDDNQKAKDNEARALQEQLDEMLKGTLEAGKAAQANLTIPVEPKVVVREEKKTVEQVKVPSESLSAAKILSDLLEYQKMWLPKIVDAVASAGGVV